MREELAIGSGVAGIDMRRDPKLLGETRLAHGKNISLREGRAQTRPPIHYHNLKISGKYQGSCYFTPRHGLSMAEYSGAPSTLVVVAGGQVNLILFNEMGTGVKKIGEVQPDLNAYPYGHHNYLFIHSECSTTYLSDAGCPLQVSPGAEDCDTGESHDTFVKDNHKHYIPHNATVGVGAHGRTIVDQPVNSAGCATILALSDILTKRGCDSFDITLFEEHALLPDSYLTAPSRMGPTVALTYLPSIEDAGEGPIVDFRCRGTVFHDTLQAGRATRASADGRIEREGWDFRRLSTVRLNEISAVGRYAHAQTPSDIVFRSKYGLHFLRTTLGIGSFNDESTNRLSMDVDPILQDDRGIEASSVGYWVGGSRVFTTVYHRSTANTTNKSARAFVSLNLEITNTEDRTPRWGWEGVWCPVDQIIDIHKFEKLDDMCGEPYGFICSNGAGELHFAEIANENDSDVTKGFDVYNGQEIPIPFVIQTGQFDKGVKTSRIDNVFLTAEINRSTRNLRLEVRSDCDTDWRTAATIDKKVTKLSRLVDYEMKPKMTSGTRFEFRIVGEGYIEVESLIVNYIEETKSTRNGNKKCVEIVKEDLELEILGKDEYSEYDTA